MKRTAQDILNFVEDNDVKFAKLTFCDIFGNQKNVSLFASELPRAFSEGVSFDGSSIAGFMNVEESDLVLSPDPDTATVLPWRPTEGRVIRMYCDITLPNGKPFEGNCRGYLQSVIKRARAMGLVCNVGCECEFYLFETDEHGSPTRIPLDMGGYFDIPPLDKGENIRREICFAIEEMGLHPEHSHHESGHGQNEIDFRYSDPLTAADNAITFRTVVRTVAAQNGLCASFSPKPLPDRDGSGMHINISAKSRDEEDVMPRIIAGILSHVAEMTVFLNTREESYHRFGSSKAPRYISWSSENRSQLIRIPAAQGEYRRAELRSPDPLCSPYLAFTLLIRAGLDGINRRLVLPDAANVNFYTAPASVRAQFRTLPETLEDAKTAAAGSDFIARCLPDSIIRPYTR